MNKHLPKVASLSALLLVGGSANAIEYTLTTGFSTERTNNVGRVSDDSGLVQKDWIHRPTLRGIVDHQGNNLQLTGDYLVEHRIYTEDVFDDRTRWTGRADLRWDALPELLQFNVTNSRTETLEDSLIQDVETNRQVTSVTSAGPKLTFRPRTSDELSLEYRYSDISQGQVNTGATIDPNVPQLDSDSERQLFTIAYELGLTENRSITAAVSRDKVDFNQNAPELEIDTASLQYESKGDALELILRGGYTTIDRTLGRDKVDGVIGRLNLMWRVSGSGQFDVTASRNINDQSDDVLRGSAAFGQGAVFENTDVNEVFEEHMLRVGYTHRWGRNTATLSYRLQNQDFEDSAFIDAQSRDEEESGFTLFLARRLTPRIEARFSGSIIERDFEDRGVVEDYLTADFRIDWQVGRSLRLFAGANYEERDARGDSPLVDQLTFDEFVYLFGFNFDLINRSKLPQKR